MKQILIIDDIPERHSTIKRLLSFYCCLSNERDTEINSVYYEEELLRLKDRQFDFVFLDHDIGIDNNIFDLIDTLLERSWVNQNTIFMIHSANPVGANNIYNTLTYKGFKYVYKFPLIF